MARHEEFKLESLRKIDGGRPAVAFELALENAVRDCADRPYDTKAREVTLKLKIAPSKTDEGMVIMQAITTAKVPALQTKVYEMMPHANGKLSFNPDLPDEPYGRTLYDEQEREEDGV